MEDLVGEEVREDLSEGGGAERLKRGRIRAPSHKLQREKDNLDFKQIPKTNLSSKLEKLLPSN